MPQTVSVMLSDRENGMIPPGKPRTPVTVPSKVAFDRPPAISSENAAWPPRTGVANT
jgi:hypothetical protein